MDRGTEREVFRGHAEVFRVLSNPLRHEIVHRLAEGPHTVSQLVEECEASKSSISQHLTLLRAYGLVEQHREGRTVQFVLRYPQLSELCRLVDGLLGDRGARSLQLHGGLSKQVGTEQ
jgi:DNA-binding transcriptional ArsR family regulator